MPRLTTPLAIAAALSCAGAMTSAAGHAAPAQVSVELNKLEPAGEDCRFYVLLGNKSGHSFESLKFDLVMFDGEGVVARRLAVEAAPLAAGKTSLKVFDVSDLACERVGRVLLNDVTSCRAGGAAVEGCTAMLDTHSRAAADFIK